MLTRLSISNYVLIDSLEIDFPEGLVIITGATGAGKSILLGALSLVLGAKSDISALGDKNRNCIVEAEFDMSDSGDEVLRNLVEENEAEWDGGRLLIRRVVATTGRSRSFLNDSPVPVSVLQEMSSHILDIHSQHETLLLKDEKYQMGLLDAFASNGGLLGECAALYREKSALEASLVELKSRISLIERDRDYNEALLSELEKANLKEGELEELEDEQKRLANAGEIKEGLCGIEEIFNGPAELSLSIPDSLKEIRRRLEKLSRFIPTMGELAERIDSSRIELEDILADVESENASFNVSEERLAEVDDRLSMIYALFRKHSVSDISSLLDIKSSLEKMCLDSSALEEERLGLESRLGKVSEQLEKAAGELHNSRKKAVPAFSRAIQDSIRSLELPLAVFSASIQSLDRIGPSGADSVSFLFSASGSSPVDVSRCASGGEMSRIMLCLKDMMARYSKMPTMIFDEIDTGVSGSVADKMGSMICDMGGRMQVFAITHLPQVAAKGDAHYLVTKNISGEDGSAVSSLRRLGGEERVMEIARMLSGARLTEAAVSNARALLSEK